MDDIVSENTDNSADIPEDARYWMEKDKANAKAMSSSIYNMDIQDGSPYKGTSDTDGIRKGLDNRDEIERFKNELPSFLQMVAENNMRKHEDATLAVDSKLGNFVREAYQNAENKEQLESWEFANKLSEMTGWSAKYCKDNAKEIIKTYTGKDIDRSDFATGSDGIIGFATTVVVLGIVLWAFLRKKKSDVRKGQKCDIVKHEDLNAESKVLDDPNSTMKEIDFIVKTSTNLVDSARKLFGFTDNSPETRHLDERSFLKEVLSIVFFPYVGLTCEKEHLSKTDFLKIVEKIMRVYHLTILEMEEIGKQADFYGRIALQKGSLDSKLLLIEASNRMSYLFKHGASFPFSTSCPASLDLFASYSVFNMTVGFIKVVLEACV